MKLWEDAHRSGARRNARRESFGCTHAPLDDPPPSPPVKSLRPSYTGHIYKRLYLHMYMVIYICIYTYMCVYTYMKMYSPPLWGGAHRSGARRKARRENFGCTHAPLDDPPPAPRAASRGGAGASAYASHTCHDTLACYICQLRPSIVHISTPPFYPISSTSVYYYTS